MICTKRIVPLFENVNYISHVNMKDNRSFTPSDPAFLPASTSCCSFSTFYCLLRDLPHTKRMAEGTAEVILSNISPSHPNSWYSCHPHPPKKKLPAHILSFRCCLPALIHPLQICFIPSFFVFLRASQTLGTTMCMCVSNCVMKEPCQLLLRSLQG